MTGTIPQTLTLYFIADNIGLDNNRDLFVWAHSSEQAITDWRANYETEDLPEGTFAVHTDNPAPGPVPWNIIRTELLT